MAKKITKTDNKKASADLPAVINHKNDLTIVQNILEHNRADQLPTNTDPLTQYVREISRYKLLTPEEEENLLKELQESGDIEVAKKISSCQLKTGRKNRH
jgi:DNA-directed RNA polymerase sigma subunit (sigma70/sigma32)